MRVRDVRQIVETAQVDPRLYSFDSDQDETLCLLAFGQT